MNEINLMLGDCLERMRELPDNSVDSIVTDPPYGLSFMGKKWDYDVPSVEMWTECLRVLKPGGHLLAFAGTRTQHRMAVRIEDAGFEIRDMIAWVYGSGFPKSLDVSKAITNRANPEQIRTIKLWLAEQFDRSGKTKTEINRECGFTASDYLKTEPGNDAGGRATWHMLLPYGRKWARLKEVVGFGDNYDAQIEQYGIVVERRNAKAATGEVYGKYSGQVAEYALTEAAQQWQGWGTALKPALEPITVARKPLIGTVAENVLTHGTGAINVDGCRVPADDNVKFERAPGNVSRENWRKGTCVGAAIPTDQGRWPANLIHDGSQMVLDLFPETGKSTGGGKNNADKFGGGYAPTGDETIGYGDTGSAARFFYCAKTAKKDRDEGLGKFEKKASGMVSNTNGQHMTRRDEGYEVQPRANNHPTVKPTDLMRYLCRLVTQPGGTVLDPFMGSGSTGKAAMLEGFDFIGVERDTAYFEIAKGRIEAAKMDMDWQNAFS